MFMQQLPKPGPGACVAVDEWERTRTSAPLKPPAAYITVFAAGDASSSAGVPYTVTVPGVLELVRNSAIATAEFLTSSKTPGTVTVYGTPAEELASPAAKTVMYAAGGFKGADVLVRSHSSTATQAPGPGFGSCCMNINVVHYTFFGAPAHQLQAWDGRDALMGVIELFNHIDGLRKTLRPETKIQGIITEGGKAPNVVPDRAAAEFWIRYPDPVYLAQVTERVNDAARGSGLATGTKVRIDLDSSSRNGISVAALNDVAFAYMKKFGATKVEDEPGRPLPFEETGTVATQIPGVG